MKNYLYLAALLLPLSASLHAEEVVSESRAIDAKVKIVNLDGLANLKLKQGATATLVVYAEKRFLSKIVTEQQGDTLRIDGPEHVSGRSPKIRAELTLPNLEALTAAGLGKSEVQGFSGDKIRLELKGAGAIEFQGSYKQVVSHLSGLGGMSLNLSNNENTEFKLSGAGGAVLRGQGKQLKVDLSGLGGLDAEKFEVDSLTLKLKGMGSASAYARQSANVSVSGMGSATVYGNPADRKTSSSGMGSVNYK